MNVSLVYELPVVKSIARHSKIRHLLFDLQSKGSVQERYKIARIKISRIYEFPAVTVAL